MADPDYKYKLITGVKAAKPSQESRKEFSAWVNDAENKIQVSLFVRALNYFMDMNYRERDSYYQIAGIHGYPKVEWDKTPNKTKDETKKGYYCTHGNYTFATWHRPYLALYEQRIWEIMKQVIIPELFDPLKDEEKQRVVWEKQADQWRLPYWDWAQEVYYEQDEDNKEYYHGHGMPYMCTKRTWHIVEPSIGLSTESTIQMKNPMWAYTGDGMLMGDASRGEYKIVDVPASETTKYPWSQCYGTSRYSVTLEKGKKWESSNNYKGTNEAITNAKFYTPDKDKEVRIHAGQLRDKVHRMLTSKYLESYGAFSTVKQGKYQDPNRGKTDWQEWLSLEYIHNNLHDWIGGEFEESGWGHMTSVPVAGFDPLFWMHHCNIDRLFAIWQELNPQHWFDGLYFAPDEPEEARCDEKTELRPFRGEDGKIFTSDDVRACSKFNYQYEILERKAGEEDNEVYHKRIAADLKDLYGGATEVVIQAAKLTPALNVEAPASSDATSSESPNTPHTDSEKFNDYLINVLYDRYGYKGGLPYTIHFFIGDEDAEDIAKARGNLRADSRHVGSIHTFSTKIHDENGRAVCENCVRGQAASDMSRAQIPITVDLINRARDTEIRSFNDISPESVEDYLKLSDDEAEPKLSWVAVDALGAVIPHTELPNTKVYVLKGTVQVASNFSAASAGPYATYGEYELMETVTKNRLWDGAQEWLDEYRRQMESRS